ncbi:hypothetical protein ACFPRL_36360 [Pseudoclavibacter helvolus]
MKRNRSTTPHECLSRLVRRSRSSRSRRVRRSRRLQSRLCGCSLLAEIRTLAPHLVPHVHKCTHAHVHMRRSAHTHVCACARVHVCTCARVRVCTRARRPTYQVE